MNGITLHKGAHGLVGARPEMGGTPSGRDLTMAYEVLKAHQRSADGGLMRITFDGMLSHDITYVGIVQTARACGLEKFPMPYALTNCHNSLCAVGGTINEDDHTFGLTAAIRYGGIYVPANQAVIHQYAREAMAESGKMLLGSDSHTRYGALGCMGVGEGGPELVKQLLGQTYDVPRPEVVLVWLTGTLRQGVGPHDVALALCAATYDNGFLKNKVLEFAGPGVANLPMDTRLGIDVMTTETTCLSSIWQTDDAVKQYYKAHGRPEAYQAMAPKDGATYDALVEIDLSKVEPMIALPFHPSNAYTIREFKQNAADILKTLSADFSGKLSPEGVRVDQGIIAGCAGGMFDNIREAAAIVAGQNMGSGAFSLSVYPSSIPQNLALLKEGSIGTLMEAGALIKPCFCGPCFGAGDVPSNGALSIRHTTRNFPSREGSRPMDGQSAGVALMDARSIAATARNGGLLTSATEIDYEMPKPVEYAFDEKPYQVRVYQGFGKPNAEQALHQAPSIAPWPKIPAMKNHLLLKLCAVIRDPVTTTDELIPSGETSSFRSNPMKLAEFTLSRRDPLYVKRAKAVNALNLDDLIESLGVSKDDTAVGSAIFANKPGDGSAREQAASCQRVLGGAANLCYEFATKRYRSNVINWGMLPFTVEEPFEGEVDDFVFVKDVLEAVKSCKETMPATLIKQSGERKEICLTLKGLTDEEREILVQGCLMNYYASKI